MNKKPIILFLVGIVLIAIWAWPRGDFKIAEIVDGNIVLLNNGTEVRLIGITSTIQGKQYLEDNYYGNKIALIPDSTSPFNPDLLSGNETVYAYLMNNDGDLCINEAMLRENVAKIMEEAYLHDRLRDFRKAVAENGRGDDDGDELTPTPVPKINYEDDEIILPPYTMPNERKHSAWYTNGNMNLEMLDEACDYDLPYTKSFANQLAARSEGNFNPGQICEIFKYCYNKWRYVNDPKGHEYVARASESIASSLTGDCDDFAVLMASCILAVGGEACVNTGFNANGGHAFTEVDISGFNKTAVLDIIRDHFPQFDIPMINTRQDGSHLWLNLDWQAAYPGGKYYDCSLSRNAYPCISGTWRWNKLK